ncbi:hypothetical protein EON67_00190, partial [archaeon]
MQAKCVIAWRTVSLQLSTSWEYSQLKLLCKNIDSRFDAHLLHDTLIRDMQVPVNLLADHAPIPQVWLADGPPLDAYHLRAAKAQPRLPTIAPCDDLAALISASRQHAPYTRYGKQAFDVVVADRSPLLTPSIKPRGAVVVETHARCQ